MALAHVGVTRPQRWDARFDPGMSEAHFEIGRLLLLEDKGPEALEHLEAYLAGTPQNVVN